LAWLLGLATERYVARLVLSLSGCHHAGGDELLGYQLALSGADVEGNALDALDQRGLASEVVTTAVSSVMRVMGGRGAAAVRSGKSKSSSRTDGG
jgi:hypothetical protein